MTAINFPDSPTVNQEFTVGDVKWVWTGVSWNVVAKTSDPFIVSETAPASPDQGDQWYDSNTGATFVYYDGYWVELNNSLPGPQGEAGPQGAVGATGATGATGPTGVVMATAPITYNPATQTVGINQAGITVAQSQVTGLVANLASKVAWGYLGGSLNFNNLTNPGMFRFDTANTNGPGFDYGNVLVVTGGTDTIAQVAFSYIEAYVKVRTAYGIGGTPIWTAWKTIGSNQTISDRAASYTITNADAGQVIRSTAASATTVTITNVLNVGDSIDFVQAGAGIITFTGSGVTLNSFSSRFRSAGQHAVVNLLCVASGVYVLSGNTIA